MRKSIFMVLLGLILAAVPTVPAFAVNGKPVRELIVSNAATGDGEYSSITAALADANGTTPVVIKVMPGTYLENTLTMKSNVHLEGAGREVTTLNLQGGTLNIPTGITNVEITDLTLIGGQDLIYCDQCGDLIVSRNKIIGPAPIGCCGGIFIESGPGDQFITDNIVTGFGVGIDVYHATGNVIVRNNFIKGNQYGVYGSTADNLKIQGNEIVENEYGISEYGSGSLTITENTLKLNTNRGITTSGNCILSNNRITNSGNYDLQTGLTTRASFNTFDTISGTLTGSFNVKSDGTPW